MPENRIKGSVICRCRDEYGGIIVAEEGNKRTLYFGEGILQSTLQTDRPYLLLEDYNEAMMSGLIFKSNPESVLLIGLGGCSLVHFLLKALPDCNIDIVEIRQQVIDLSRDFFLLPSESAKIRIFHASGSDFIEQQQQGSAPNNYDMIIVDAFDEAGPAAALLEKTFLAACRVQLNRNGVFIMNLWNSLHYNFPAMYRSIQDAFGDNTLKLLLSESCSNAVAFGFENPAACRHLLDYRSMAAELQSKYRINFPKYLRYLYTQNFDGQDQ